MAQPQIYARKAQIHLDDEGTVDTYSGPGGSGTDMFLAENVTYTVEGDNYVPSYVRADYLGMDESPGMMSATCSFEVPIKGSGTAGTAPEFSKALLGCGMRQSIVSATSVTYYPYSVFDGGTAVGPPATTNPAQSYSVSFLVNGIRYSLKGGFGTMTIRAEVGVPAKLQFSFQGAYNAVADDALEAPTYNATKAPSFLGATLAANFGGSTTPYGVENLEFVLGNTITLGRHANDASGIYGARIVGRKSTGSFDPEAVLVATYDWFGKQRAGTHGTLATGTVGSTAGNRWALNINRAALRPIGVSDRNGILAYSIPYGVTSLNTDVEGTNPDVTLVFT